MKKKYATPEEAREAARQKNREWRAAHPERVKQYKKSESVRRAERMASDPEYAAKERARSVRTSVAWLKTKAGKEYKRAKDAEYRRRKNQDESRLSKARLSKAASARRQMERNIQARIAKVVRTRIGSALARNATKAGLTTELLGCTIPELRSHLESQFQPGMTWDNWTVDGWHIDHIRALAKFDLTDAEQQRMAFHYTNLQPLWAADNLRKGVA